MICSDCEKHKAEWVWFPDFEDSIRLLCDGCMEEYIHMEGEMNLTFYRLDDLAGILREVKEKFEYYGRKLEYARKEHFAMKAELEKLGKPAEEVAD